MPKSKERKKGMTFQDIVVFFIAFVVVPFWIGYVFANFV